MSTSHVLLGLLSGGARHGYELKRAHDDRLPQAKPLAFGQVYATLGRLERDGLVEQSGQDRDAGPDRTSYSLTGAGRTRLAEWLAAIESPAPYVTSTLFAKVMVSLLVAGEETTTGYLIAQREAHVARLRELTGIKTARGASAGDVVAADYAIAHLDADLRWLQTTLLRVAELNQEVNS
ncbi:PadR family transcriptional regulator [Actinoplanes sp. TFC3]|uniref:PadR family transcriptional regulator n=1 Tax=Actinoplanes sp. TFC3 TaxID=1710355 RepID=UPI00083635E9|nr:PadR family transcriptional regulator [Actinoplanes sp. TFC3]